MTPTPRTDAETMDGAFKERGCTITLQQWDYYRASDGDVVMADFARTLEREITELNERLIDRQQTLMEWIIENRNLKRELAKGNLAQILALRTAIEETLEANRGLADGDDCTLKALKDAVGWE